MSCLDIKDLCISRQKNGASFTLNVPELSLNRGEILAIVGQSGCGKSTLTDTLGLILEPTSAGTFMLNGKNGQVDLLSVSPSVKAQLRGTEIGYVLQSGGLFPFLDVLDNIMLPGRLLGLDEKNLKERAVELASSIGIADQLHKKPQHLSGGQRQRVAIARAVIHNPPIVLADEPTAAVDQVSANDICVLLSCIVRENNASLVIVSHDRELMKRYADFEVTFRIERNDGIVSTLLAPQPARISA